MSVSLLRPRAHPAILRELQTNKQTSKQTNMLRFFLAIMLHLYNKKTVTKSKRKA
jgi:hypothetical protein